MPGLAAPDSSFENDGKLTKRDARASALAKLAPFPGAVSGMGSGSGAVSVDFLRNAPRGSALAIDRVFADQLARATANAEAHGVAGLQAVGGDAGKALGDLQTPDAVFIGGGLEAVISAAQARAFSSAVP